MEHTIEHYLIKLTSVANSNYNFKLMPSDEVILSSIARQVSRGVALTDRQYSLVKSKLVNYRDQFEKNNMNHLDDALMSVRQPLRSIDRSQTVTVEDNMMVVKFPFNKKMIAQLDVVSSVYKQFYTHVKGSNEHKFKLYEPVIHKIVELFKNKKFDIDPHLLEVFEKIESIKTREMDFVPYITDHGLVNVSESAIKLAHQEIGEFNEPNMIKYWDRSLRYGYRKTAKLFRNNSQLTEHLANRSTMKEYVNPKVYTLTDIATALKELDRFPLLVTLNHKNEYLELQQYFNVFDYIDPQQQIVLDRIENSLDPNVALNSFIKEKNFSRWLDKDTKIVYIFKNSLPKLLLKNEWRPIAHVSLNGEREQSNTASYIDQHCDLSVYHDAQPSYWINSIARQLIQWV
jgi:hypothetical protein